MLGFLALLLIDAVLFTAQTLLAPKPQIPDATPEDQTAPTSREGDPIPVVWGTCRVPANAVMFSSPIAIEEKEKVQVGLFSSRNVTIGYQYAAIMEVLVCHGPVDELIDLVWQDSKSMNGTAPITVYKPQTVGGLTRYVPTTEIANQTDPVLPILRTGVALPDGGTQINAKANDMFGGVQHGGGITGPIFFYWGTATQQPSNTLEHECDIPDSAAVFDPNYEGICHLVFGLSSGGDPTRFNFGEFGNLPPLNVIVRRCPSALGLSGAQTNLSGGANPAEAIYELLTNLVWGLGVPVNQIDTATFAAAGATLATENFGLNLSLTTQSSGDATINEVLRYIDGQVQQDPITGLLTLTLNRNDYVFGSLPVVDESSASDATLTRPSWSDLKNEIKVTYTKILNGVYKQTTTAPIQDLAAQRNFGNVNPLTIDYPAVTDAVVAVKLATRDLRKVSTPLAQVKGLKVNRSAANWALGTPFVLSWAEYGIANHVFRVASIDYGSLEDGTIVVDCVEDIFGIEQPFYDDPVEGDAPNDGFGDLSIPKVTPLATHDATTGYLELQLVGGAGRVTSVEFQEQSGAHDLTDWHVNQTHDGFKDSVDLDAKHTSLIAWRVQGTLTDGTIGTLIDGQVEYPISTQPARPVLAFVLDPDTGQVDIIADVDSDTATLKLAASLTDIPDETAVAATTAHTVPDGVTRLTILDVITLTPNSSGYVSAISYDSNGNPSPIATIPINFGQAEVTARITLVSVTPNALTGVSCDVQLKVEHPNFLGGTLTVWLHHDFTASPNFTDTPDGSIHTGATPDVFGPTDAFTPHSGIGTLTLLRDIVVHASQGKRIFAEFLDSAGISSGQQSFFINGGGGRIGPDGELLPGSIKNAAAFAAGIQPIEVWPDPLPSRPDGTIVLDSTDKKLYKRVAGAWQPVVQAVDLTGVLTSAQIADGIVTTAKFASGLRPVRIVTGLPGTGQLEGDIVYDTITDKTYRWTGTAWDASVAAPDITGQLSAAQIATGAISQTKLASGLQAVVIVSSIPGTNVGNIIYNSSDGKLWRWVGTSYSPSVPTSDLTGTIAAAQLVGSVQLTSFASTIQPVVLVSSVPGTNVGNVIFNQTDGKLYRWQGSAYSATIATGDIVGTITSTQITDNSVTSPKIAANAVTAGKIAALAVTAGTLAADAVTAGTIAAGAITAREISAGSITAGKLAIGFGEGMALNSDPNTTDPSAWGAINNTTSAPATLTLATDPNLPAGLTYFSSANARVLSFSAMPYDGGRTYRARMYTRNIGGNGLLYPLVRFADRNGNTISPPTAPGAYHYFGTIGINPPGTGWTFQEIVFGVGLGTTPFGGGATAPPDPSSFGNGLTMQIGALLNYSGSSGAMGVAGMRIEEVLPGTLIGDGAISTPKIQAGAVTTNTLAALAVTAGKVAANAITTGTIAANAVTAGTIAVGAVTAGTIAAAAVNTAQLAANAVTAANIAAGAITADKLFIGGSAGAALNSDPQCFDATAWTITNGNLTLTTGGQVGAGVIISTTGTSECFVKNKTLVSVDRAKTYRVHAWVWKSADANGSLFLGVDALDANQAHINGPAGTFWYTLSLAAGGVAAGWNQFDGFVGLNSTQPGQFGSNVFYMQLIALLNEGGNAGTWLVQDFRLDEVNPGTLIQDGAISTNKITANAITTAKIAAGAVTATEIAAGAIVAGKLAANSVTTATMAANSISGDRIQANTMNATAITSGTITSGQIGANSIVAGAIAAGAINSSAIIADSVVVSTKLSVGSLSSISSNLGIVTFGRLQNFAGTTYLDLSASGAGAILHHAGLDLFADGSANFGGIVSAATFTTSSATFSGRITATGSFSLLGSEGSTGVLFYTGGVNYGILNLQTTFSPGGGSAALGVELVSLNGANLVLIGGGSAGVYMGGTVMDFAISSSAAGVGVRIAAPPTTSGTDTTPLFVVHRNGSTFTLKNVTVAGTDSAGSGWRALRVAN